MTTRKIEYDTAARLAHRELLETLAQKADPRHAALLIVDMQNDFCASDGLIAKEGLDVSEAQKTAARLPAFIAAARRAGVLVVFIRNQYTTDGNFYLADAWLEQAARKRHGGYTTLPVCTPGSWQADFYGEVRPEPGDPVVTKHRYSGFHNTDLDTILRAHGIRTIILTGVVTNVCVETTAREGFVRDYYVLLVDDGAAAYLREDHEMTLKNIDRFFGQVTSIAELTATWSKAR
mgnify:CR=1 FL=1